ncbi:MAG: glycosyltransferase, partial [Acutalibacteraceae bacterium]|nr:glycosyltransferase [Acutalibacteraceae bacterium]
AGSDEISAAIEQMYSLDSKVYLEKRANARKKIEWVHIGDGPLMSDMQNYAKQKLAKTNIEYRFLGQLALSDVHKYYESAKVNLFVNCSDTEGTPVSVMEAMSYGIPCIARNVGGMAEVLTDECGVLLDADAGSDEISAAIEQMYSLDSKVYLEKRANARKKIEDEFDAAKNFKDYILRVTALGK